MILNNLLEQLNDLDEKYPTARVYIEADHGQTPESATKAVLFLVDKEDYYLHDDIDKYAIEDLDEDQINNLLEDGFQYVVVIR